MSPTHRNNAFDEILAPTPQAPHRADRRRSIAQRVNTAIIVSDIVRNTLSASCARFEGYPMWFTLFLAVIVCVAVLYVPGYLIGRSLSLQRTVACAAAPALSLALLVALGVLFREANISCHALVLAAATGALALAAFGLTCGIRRRRPLGPNHANSTPPPRPNDSEIPTPARLATRTRPRKRHGAIASLHLAGIRPVRVRGAHRMRFRIPNRRRRTRLLRTKRRHDRAPVHRPRLPGFGNLFHA